MLTLQERSGSSSLLSSTSSFEGYSKPATGALGDRMSAMKQAFQVELSRLCWPLLIINHDFLFYIHFGLVNCMLTSILSPQRKYILVIFVLRQWNPIIEGKDFFL